MSEVFRALGFLLILSGVVFYFAEKALVPQLVSKQDFHWRRNTWIAITLVAFLAHNFWLFIALAACVLLFAGHRETNRLALFFCVMFAVPQITATIPGLGLLDQLFPINYLVVACMVLLLPTYLALRRQRDVLALGSLGADWFVVAFLVLQCALFVRVTTFTDALRQTLFLPFFEAFLPYYVASRLPRSGPQLRQVMVAFAVTTLVLAAIGTFEYAKSWLLYNSLKTSLSGAEPWAWGYLPRGDSLRAAASTGQAIPLGYVITVGIAFWLAMREHVQTGLWRAGLALLCGGLLATISRGPWAGAIAMTLVWAATGPTPMKNVSKVLALGAVATIGVLISPMGQKVIDLIPFVGTTEPQNSQYRQDFLVQSMIIIDKYPWFGLANFARAPEFDALRSASGMVDTLNIFFTIAIANGVIGLLLFVGAFLAPLRAAMRRYKEDKRSRNDTAQLGRGLIAAWFAIVVIINTISGITIIPIVYWSVLGLCVAYANLQPESAVAPGVQKDAGRGAGLSRWKRRAGQSRAPAVRVGTRKT